MPEVTVPKSLDSLVDEVAAEILSVRNGKAEPGFISNRTFMSHIAQQRGLCLPPHLVSTLFERVMRQVCPHTLLVPLPRDCTADYVLAPLSDMPRSGMIGIGGWVPIYGSESDGGLTIHFEHEQDLIMFKLLLPPTQSA